MHSKALVGFRTGCPAMPQRRRPGPLETSSAPRFLHALVAGFAGVLAAALFLGAVRRRAA